MFTGYLYFTGFSLRDLWSAYATETTEFEGAKFQASSAVHLRPSFFRDVTRHTLPSVAYPGGFGVFKPPPEILKALQNRAKLNPIVKTVKNC